jgi:phosphoribosylglycinamide formyltransferase-1
LPAINIVVLVSGGGTNLQALLDAEKKGAFCRDGIVFGKITAVVSDRSGAYALERAKIAGVPGVVAEPDRSLPKEQRRQELSDRILGIASEHQAGLLVLAGFLSILSGKIIREYSGRIINLHPALLPKFGGDGMYGEHVHRAVLDAREKESGCTVHLVDAGTDTGPILLQRRVPVLPDDTPDTLARRIHWEEHFAIVEASVKMAGRLYEQTERSNNK